MGFSGERCARKPWEQQLEAMDLGAGHTGRRTVAPAPVAQIGLITSVNRAIDRKPGFFLRRCQKGRSLNMRGGGLWEPMPAHLCVFSRRPPVWTRGVNELERFQSAPAGQPAWGEVSLWSCLVPAPPEAGEVTAGQMVPQKERDKEEGMGGGATEADEKRHGSFRRASAARPASCGRASLTED